MGERLLYLILKELNERLNSRRLRGLRRLNWGTTMLFPKKFLHNKRDTIELILSFRF
jgi:hypothetical protein